MPIDEPVGILIKQAEEEMDVRSYLPAQLTKLGITGIFAAALTKLPFAASVLGNLIMSNGARFEERVIYVLKEMDEQHARIEDKIEDKGFYRSEEFQTLIGLIMERLHTTHDKEKLKLFGDALANSGSVDFQSDDKEAYIRILRDLSAKDLQILGEGSYGWRIDNQSSDERISGLSRLAGNGLVVDWLEVKTPSQQFGGGNSREAAAHQVAKILATPPLRRFHLSEFGKRFLKFITSEPTASTN
jgi:hypothetical protein